MSLRVVYIPVKGGAKASAAAPGVFFPAPASAAAERAIKGATKLSPQEERVAAARAAAAERRMDTLQRLIKRVEGAKDSVAVRMTEAHEELHRAPPKSVRGRLNTLLEALQSRVDTREDVFCALDAHYVQAAEGGAGAAAAATTAPAMGMAMAPPPPADDAAAPLVMAPPPPADAAAPIVMAPPPPADAAAPIVMAPPPPADAAAPIAMGEAPAAEEAAPDAAAEKEGGQEAAAPAGLTVRERINQLVSRAARPAQPVTMYLPVGVNREVVLESLAATAAERAPYHRRMFVYSVALTPVTATFTLLPGPNVFFAWNAWRAYRHYSAWQGAARLAGDFKAGSAARYLMTRFTPDVDGAVADLYAHQADADAGAAPEPLEFPPTKTGAADAAQKRAAEVLAPLGVRLVALQRFLRRLRATGLEAAKVE